MRYHLPTMKTRLLIAYDGSEYSGWQVQPNSVSIQGTLEETLEIVLRRPTRLIGSGRTDAGVHAIGQVAHFVHEEPIQYDAFRLSMNGILPPAIRVRQASAAPARFHAQHSATGKIYHYFLGIGSVIDPFRRPYRVQHYHPLDISLLRAGAACLIGTHDFTSFANHPNEGSVAKDPVRTLTRLDVIEEEDGVRLEFEADGFLYKMVRNIVGTLLEVGGQRRAVDDIPKLFAARDRRQVGMAAPPHGLFLIQVHYPSLAPDGSAARLSK